MKTTSFASYFKFSKSQRYGILILLSAIASLQFLYFFFGSKPDIISNQRTKQQWLDLPVPKDSIATHKKGDAYVMRPFNPNFITDFKGYKLGMSLDEIDRLLAYRKTNRYVNSALEFQQVTKVDRDKATGELYNQVKK